MSNVVLPRARAARGLALVFLLGAGTGCHLYHNLGTGERYDTPPARPLSKNSTKVRDMVVEITTDASGAVVAVKFQRSSGSDVVDQYVAQSVHNNWPGAPSTRSVVELTYSGVKGFSDPKVLSSQPAAPPAR